MKWRKIGFILWIGFLWSSSFLQARGIAANFWNKADSFYAMKEYDSALVHFLRYGEMAGESADLHYNLGNTYFRLNRVGPSVLHFEKALFLAPGDAQIRENLLLAKSRVSNRIAEWKPIFFVRWWERIIRQDMATLWAVSALGLYILLLLAMLGPILGIGPRIPKRGLGGMAALWLVMMVLGFFSAAKRQDSGRGVVMTSHASLQASPEPGKPQSLVPEGTTVIWNQQRGSWVELTLPDGRRGWMEIIYLEKI